jgi:hypothetical protein
MGFFSSRPNFEDRSIVQWMGESVNLSGHTNFDMSGYNTYFYNSYVEYLEGISGGTGYQNYLASFYTLSGDTFEGDDNNPTSGFTNQPTLIPGHVRITPPRGIIYSGNTNIISGYTALQDVTNFIATSYDSTGTIMWRPLSGLTSMSGSCTPDFYVGTIHPCSSGGTVTIEGNLLVRGETISATTIIETETILVEDNNISMNYGGDHTTAIGGGITILSGVSNTQDSTIMTDSNGVFIFNPGLSSPSISACTNFYTDTIRACSSDITIKPSNSGNVYVGTTGFTFDLNNNWFGMGTTPTKLVDIVNGGTNLYLDDASTVTRLHLNGDNDYNWLGVGTPVDVLFPGQVSAIAMGSIGQDVGTTTGFGVSGDTFIYSGAWAYGLNIISENSNSSSTEDYIRFYAGQVITDGLGADIHIHGEFGSPYRGYVGFNNETPTEQVDIIGSIKMVDGNESNGYVLTSDANGVGSWAAPSGGSFTGNTSGSCITDLHVSNIHSCSPLNINPNNEGDIYFGTLSANTLDLTNDRLGLGIVASGSRTSTAPLDTLELGEGKWIGFNTTIAPSSTSKAGIHFKEGVSGGYNGYGVDMYYNATSGDDRLIIEGVFGGVSQGGMMVHRSGKIGIGMDTTGSTAGTTLQVGETGNVATLKFVDGNQDVGKVLTSDADGVATWQASSGGSFTGNTSGSCITDLHVSNIHSCSPLYVNSSDEGNIQFGSSLSIFDVTNERFGVGTLTPDVFTEFRKDGNGSDARMRLRNGSQGVAAQAIFDIFAQQNVGASSVGGASLIATSDTFTGNTSFNDGGTGYATQSFNIFSNGTFDAERPNSVNIISSKSDGNIRFFTGQGAGTGTYVDNTALKMVIKEDAGAGFSAIGVNTPIPTETFQIGDSGNTSSFRFVDGNQAVGKVLTSDADGVATWQASGGGSGTVGGSGTTQNIPMWDSSTTLTDSNIAQGAFGIELNDFTQANGDFTVTGTTVIYGDETIRKKGFQTLTDAATVSWDMDNGLNAEVTLDGSRTLDITNVEDGDYGTLVVIQGGIGSHTLTLDGTFTNRVSNGGAGAVTLTTTIGAHDIITWVYNKGTNTMYWTTGSDYT